MVILQKIVFFHWVLCQFYPASAPRFWAYPRGGAGLGYCFMGLGKAGRGSLFLPQGGSQRGGASIPDICCLPVLLEKKKMDLFTPA